MEDEEIRRGLQALLEGEITFHTMVSDQLAVLCADNPLRYEYLMALQQMIRCFGQLDGISLVVDMDGDVRRAIRHITAEIAGLSEKMKQIQERTQED